MGGGANEGGPFGSDGGIDIIGGGGGAVRGGGTRLLNAGDDMLLALGVGGSNEHWSLSRCRSSEFFLIGLGVMVGAALSLSRGWVIKSAGASYSSSSSS